jgi:hypothetical protein
MFMVSSCSWYLLLKPRQKVYRTINTVHTAVMQAAVLHLENVVSDICCPFFNDAGCLHFLSQEAGEVYAMDRAGRVGRY